MSFKVKDCKCIDETPKSLKIKAPIDPGKNIYIAKSQLEPSNELEKPGDHGTLVITDWLAETIGWTEKKRQFQQGTFDRKPNFAMFGSKFRWDDSELVLCAYCGRQHLHIQKTDGNLNMVVVELRCEHCPHKTKLVIEFHEGTTFIRTEKGKPNLSEIF